MRTSSTEPRLVRLVLAALLLVGASLNAEVWRGVAVAPDGRIAWVAPGDTTYVMRTWDFGIHWQKQPIRTVRAFRDIDCTDGNHAWTIGTLGLIWFTSDGGVNWETEHAGGPHEGLRVSCPNDSTGWAAGTSTFLLKRNVPLWDMLMLSDTVLFEDSVDLQGLHLRGPQDVLIASGSVRHASGQGFVIRYFDAGDSWRVLYRDTVCDFFDIALFDSMTGCVVGGGDRDSAGCVMRTTDGGSSWAPAWLPGSVGILRAVDFNGPAHGWACGHGGAIIATTDRGASWHRQTTGTSSVLYDIEFVDAVTGMACGDNVVLRTMDGGQMWETVVVGVAEEAHHARMFRLSAAPNPFRSRVVIHIDTPGKVMVYASDGSLVRSLDAATGTCTWDGRNQSGRPGPAGVYTLVMHDSPARRIRVARLQ